MSDIWPQSVFRATSVQPDETFRAFRCVLLMPFSGRRFDVLAETLEQIVRKHVSAYLPGAHLGEAVVERLDWVTSAGAIQHQLWERIATADVVFCDITGQNPNVMFEAGVCAAWKEISQVIFLRDEFYRPDPPFDIAPFRYATYRMTSDGMPAFQQTVARLLQDVFVGFPDRLGSAPSTGLPVKMDFSDNRDDQRLYTPPFAHRRVREGRFEFGSLWSFPQSWATIGKTRLSTFALAFSATFAKTHPDKENGYIGVSVRSQNYYAGFGHIVYLNRDGSITMAQPSETSEGFTNILLRGPHPIDVSAEHPFEITFSESALAIRIDECSSMFPIADMPKVLGPGLIRFQSHVCWMAISRLALSAA